MRTLALSLALAVALVALPYQSRAQAATEFFVWPAQYSYGTPSGAFTWNSTIFGLRLSTPIAPHFGIGAGLYYGSVANLALGGAGLNGFTGNTLAGDLSLRFGTSVRMLDLGAFAGYQAFGLAANGSTPADRLLLQTSGFRMGGDIRFHLSNGLVLGGGVTILPSLNSSETFSVSTPPPPPANFNGTGSGTEYEVGLGYSLLNFSAFVGYRSGNYQTNWSGSPGSTSTTFSGYVFSLETRF